MDNPTAPLPGTLVQDEPAKAPLPLPDAPTMPMSDGEADRLANQVKFGLPFFTKTKGDLYNAFISGMEDDVRREAVSEYDSIQSDGRKKAITEALNQKPTGDQLKQIAQLIQSPPITNHSIFFEKQFGKMYADQFNKAGVDNPDSFNAKAVAEMPDEVDAYKHATSIMVAQRMVASQVLENAIKVYKAQSLGGFLVDMAKPIVNPLYGDIKFRGIVSGDWMSGFGTNLRGTAIQDEVAKLSSIYDIEEYKRVLTDRVNKLLEDNPSAGVFFAHAAMGVSTSDARMENLLNSVDLFFGGQLITAGVKKVRDVVQGVRLAKGFKDILESTRLDESPAVAAASGTGDVTEAAVQKTTQRLVEGVDDPVRASNDSMLTFMKQGKNDIFMDPTRNYRELDTRLANAWRVSGDKFAELWGKIAKIDRIPSVLKVETAVRSLLEDMKGRLTGLNNHILDIMKPVKDPTQTHYTVEFRLGDTGAVNFADAETAKARAILWELGEHSIVKVDQNGGQYYISVTKPLNETMDVIRDGLIALDTKSPTITGWISRATSYIGKGRTSDEVLSLENRMQRKVVAYATNLLYKYAKEDGKYIEDLFRGAYKVDRITGDNILNYTAAALGGGLSAKAARQRSQDWIRILDLAKDLENPLTNIPGRWFKDRGELSDFYLTHLKRMPDDVEVEAYFAHRRLHEFDYIVRNLEVYKGKARRGVETWKFTHLDENGKFVYSPEFNGTLVPKVPQGTDALLYVGPTAKESSLHRLDSLGNWQKKFEDGVLNGTLKIIKLDRPADVPLAGWGPVENTHFVRYVVASKAEPRSLDFWQLPRQEGGHFIYDAENFIKQANTIPENIGKHFRRIYIGDTTIAPVKVGALGDQMAERLEGFRVALGEKGSNVDAARKYLKDNPIGISFDEIHGWFKPTRNPDSGHTLPPKLNFHEKIQVVPRDKRIIDINSQVRDYWSSKNVVFEDGTRIDSSGGAFEVPFTSERDALGMRTIVNKGTVNNPLFEWVKAPRLDPIATMNRSIGGIIRSTFLDDYKIMAVEHWMQEAKQVHEALTPDIGQLRGSPFYYFAHADQYYSPSLSPSVKARLEAQRYHIKQLLGVPSTWQNAVQEQGQRLMDSIYNKTGSTRGAEMIADYAIPFAQDPLSVIRTMTFHAKLGLFAFPQFIVQNMTFVPIFAIAGLRPAIAGSSGALLKQWSRMNSSPAMMAALDKKISSLNFGGTYAWKPGEWLEATQAMDRVGMDIVQGEHIMREGHFSTNIIRSGSEEFLDAGLFFFREGERNARYGAWYTAYKEYRAANPIGKFTDADLKQVLERADTLYGNMSRASASAIHRGVFTPMTQFLSYNIRLAEQMTGKRLTVAEKVRLGAVNAAMYGVPAAGGLTAIPWFGDKWRQYAVEHFGYVPGDQWLSTLINEGAIAFIGAYSSGYGDLTDVSGRVRTGELLNFGQRFGNTGMEWIRDIFRQDKSAWNIFLGAPGQFIGNTIANFDPMFRVVQQYLTKKPEERFQASASDLADILNEVAGFKGPRRMLAAWETQKWLSYNGIHLTDVGPVKAAVLTLTGTQPQEVADLQTFGSIRKGQEENEKWGLRNFNREYTRWMTALDNNDPKQADKFFNRAMWYADIAGIPIAKLDGVFSQANEAGKDLVSRIRWNMFINPKNLPPGTEEKRLDQFGRMQDIKNKKEELRNQQ